MPFICFKKAFQMSFATLWYFLLSSLLIAALPGPAMMLVIQGAVQGGWQKGVAVSSGILLADMVLLLLVCLGLGELMASAPKLLRVMNILAAGYLIYLGARSWYGIRHISGSLVAASQTPGWKTGFLITIINPKTIIFLLAYLPQFVHTTAAKSEAEQLLLLSGLFLIAVAVVMFAYTFAAHIVRRPLSRPIVRRLMALLFGCLLIYLGISGLWKIYY